MRLQDLLDVSQARDEGDFKHLLLKEMAEMDFERVVAVLRLEDEHGRKITDRIVHNLPGAYVEMATDRHGATHDPCLRQQLSMHAPAVYDRQTFVDHGASELWERAAPFGMRTGIAVSLHLPRNRKFVLSLDRHRALPSDEETLARLLADVQLLAVYAQGAAHRLFELEPACTRRVPRLTPREMEVLSWTKAGKSSWEIGRVLSMSENTVNFHVKNAVRKLSAVNRRDAVVKAISLGIL
jgi:DNA-binding CsgD family transcriptional regulator